MNGDFSTVATLAIAALGTAGVIARPWKLPEAVWATGAAILLLLTRLLPFADGLRAIGKGFDVYLFLTGMMLLSELARREGLFDYLASHAAKAAQGSPTRLFLLIYATGTIVTIFMSNDATAVVLTPAVFAAARAAKAKPLPYLFICAFIANAASFVLPISNPANLVLFQSHTPPLMHWLGRFFLPSALSIGVTFFILRYTQRRDLIDPIETRVDIKPLGTTGNIAACGIALTALALMAASAFDLQLGWPSFAAGLVTASVVVLIKRETPWHTLKDISWNVLPLVAGLFVMVEALDHSGFVKILSDNLQRAVARSIPPGAGLAGAIIALACNFTNNLPAGLIAAMAVTGWQAPHTLVNALLVGVDLGPNLSVTGSLATILWLAALRREGEHVSAWQFLKLGAVLMPAALIPALAAVMLIR